MPVELNPLPMDEAKEYWATKVPMPASEFYALADAWKARAFTVSGIAEADVLAMIFDSIGKALEEGTSFDDWKASLSDVWENQGWTGVKAWRVDNIFRTNIQTAYATGRYKQMVAVKESRPYWQYSAVNDSRTRPTHAALHGKIYPADSEFWDTFYPPNGFRCRCSVKTLSSRQVEQRGLEVGHGKGLGELIEPVDPVTGEKMPARPLMPDKGFETNSAKEGWNPDLSKYPANLRQPLEQRLAARKQS
jgi:SPP1 gp7 family putative phage head morphogenesis protein